MTAGFGGPSGFASWEADKEGDKQTWVLDSGATRHICPNREWFKDLRKTDATIKAADGRPMRIEGVGTVDVWTQTSRGRELMPIHNVLFIPDASSCFFSQTAVEDRGYRIEFRNRKCYVKRGTEVLAKGQRPASLYIMDFVPAAVTEAISMTAVAEKGSLIRKQRKTGRAHLQHAVHAVDRKAVVEAVDSSSNFPNGSDAESEDGTSCSSAEEQASEGEAEDGGEKQDSGHTEGDEPATSGSATDSEEPPERSMRTEMQDTSETDDSNKPETRTAALVQELKRRATAGSSGAATTEARSEAATSLAAPDANDDSLLPVHTREATGTPAQQLQGKRGRNRVKLQFPLTIATGTARTARQVPARQQKGMDTG